MIAGLDSSFNRPTPAQASAAYAAGVRVWGGYLGIRPVHELGLATLWSQADFDVVRNAGMTAIGFCSGWDDPVAIRDKAAAWGVRPCVDVETGIRDDGPWVQSWLDASGAGLYGNSSVHYNTGGRVAAFHIVAWYFAVPPACFDPALTWPWWLPAVSRPTAWQFCGTHDEFGLSVDRGWYDDWFGGAFSGGTVGGSTDMLSDGLKVGLSNVVFRAVYKRAPSQQELFDFANTLNADGSNLADLVQGLANNTANPDLAPLQNEALAKAVADLKAASPVANHTHTVSVSGTSGPAQ